MRKGLTSNARLVCLSLAILSCFGVVAARLAYLHWYQREAYLVFIAQARNQRTIEPARRGDILDARGNVLATSRTLVELGVDQLALRPEDETKWPQLAELLGMPFRDLQFLMRPHRKPPAGKITIDLAFAENAPDPKRWVRLSEGLEESVYDRVAALGIKGVYGSRQYRRIYPKDRLAAHILGYVNKEDKPAAGVEAYMDFYLRGQSGWKEGERDGQRRELAQFRTREIASTPGYDVVLTLDEVAQQYAEAELDSIAAKFQPQAASIIISRPRTGEILALANWPTFNLNEFNSAPLEVQKNIAITDRYEPGSAFKIVASAGALNEKLVTPATVFDCSVTELEYDGKMRKLPGEAHGGLGRLSVAEIIAKSSNRGAAYLGRELGAQRLYAYAHAFGFGDETGFPFGGEVSGVLRRPENWDGLTITRLPMGHAVDATPLQVHYAMSVIANDGVLVRPWIIREIRDSMGRSVALYEGLEKRQVVTRATAKTVARFLIEAASAEGTGQAASIDGYEVAGKTGTTQKIIDGRYSDKHHVGTFVGFFPADDPQLLITVVVNDGHPPKGLAYGGVVSAPSFKHLGEQLIPYLGIQRSDPHRAPARSQFASAIYSP